MPFKWPTASPCACVGCRLSLLMEKPLKRNSWNLSVDFSIFQFLVGDTINWHDLSVASGFIYFSEKLFFFSPLLASGPASCWKKALQPLPGDARLGCRPVGKPPRGLQAFLITSCPVWVFVWIALHFPLLQLCLQSTKCALVLAHSLYFFLTEFPFSN